MLPVSFCMVCFFVFCLRVCCSMPVLVWTVVQDGFDSFYVSFFSLF